jgi:RsiW-degrading membrane proteinase PrsW (M82 family)
MTLNVVAALLPATAFLALLFLMDSFKLLSYRSVAFAVAAGAASALAATVLHEWLLTSTELSLATFSRYVAPVTEECVKAAYVVLLLHRRRFGFLVDAAVIGFAIGVGFALVENLYYLEHVRDTRLIVWLVRGFGPAILHGATTAIFAMLAKSVSDQHRDRPLALTILPGLAMAIGVHSVYNHFPLPPLIAACVLVVGLPMLMTVVFTRSERVTREWVGDGMDLDVELLRLLMSADFGTTRLGLYLRELRARFPGEVVADMFCLLRLELELAIRAKGMLLAREAGLDVPPDPALAASLQELTFLQASVGRIGLLALKPLRATTSRDDWHRHLLQQTVGQSRAGVIGAIQRSFRW